MVSDSSNSNIERGYSRQFQNVCRAGTLLIFHYVAQSYSSALVFTKSPINFNPKAMLNYNSENHSFLSIK